MTGWWWRSGSNKEARQVATAEDGNVLQDVAPDSIRRVHLLGVAGTGMGSFAGLLKAKGYVVSGSDNDVYPPMSEMLRAWGIEVLTPYRAENLDAAKPDLVVVGNVIRRVNPEATAARERGLPQMSFPAAFGSLFLAGRHPVVVTGTHGKTTTSALLSHLLVTAGLDPSFLVGGVAQNGGTSFRLGHGPHVVVEGDEYDTAYFDKGPKFLHYRPRTAMLTSVELDHADIYRDEAHYQSAFESFVKLLPNDGFLAVSAHWPRALDVASHARCRRVLYARGPHPGAGVWAEDVQQGTAGTRFTLVEQSKPLGHVELLVPGLHNVENAVGAWAVVSALGLSFPEAQAGFASFAGVRRRQELRAEVGGVAVIDDFAHHPTAVRETVQALLGRFPGRRLWAVFEPRSNTSRRKLHQAAYVSAFEGATRVSLRIPERHDRVPEGEELDVPQLVGALRGRGLQADAERDVPALVEQVATEARPGDVILVMSNGSFGGFLEALIAKLRARSAEMQ
jgi:UDP-N-acetylmuramate: L-alanyl-gamma-D-glutamyl-meso-diaminopimelate ligase